MIDIHTILVRPLITEKSMSGSELGTYTFEVHPKANKAQIKQAVRTFLKVDPVSINTAKVSGKTRRYGKTTGKTKSWKKAIITIKPGQKIELFES